jgi:hypothetical protein
MTEDVSQMVCKIGLIRQVVIGTSAASLPLLRDTVCRFGSGLVGRREHHRSLPFHSTVNLPVTRHRAVSVQQLSFT